MEFKTMDGCRRCPTCNILPTMTMEPSPYDGEELVWLQCEIHGFVACGHDLEHAVLHWNKFLAFVTRQAADHYLTNGAGKVDESYCSVCGFPTKTEDLPGRAECAKCHAVKTWKSEPKKRASGGGLIALLLGLAMLALPLQAATQARADMQQYADNAIMDAATHGQKKVVLVFGNADQDAIDQLADELRDRGYRIDEEAQLLNPRIIKVQYLKASAMASVKKPEVTQ